MPDDAGHDSILVHSAGIADQLDRNVFTEILDPSARTAPADINFGGLKSALDANRKIVEAAKTVIDAEEIGMGVGDDVVATTV